MKKDKSIFQIKKAFTPNVFNKIKNLICSEFFPWHYISTTALPEEKSKIVFSNLNFKEKVQENFSFYHLVSSNNPIFYYIEIGLITILEKYQMELDEILRMRIGMITKGEIFTVHNPHVDFDHSPKKYFTCLMYLTTCNAPTYLYKNYYDRSSEIGGIDFLIKNAHNSMEVDRKIPSIENTAVIIDGDRYHSSTKPTDVPRRITININFTIK